MSVTEKQVVKYLEHQRDLDRMYSESGSWSMKAKTITQVLHILEYNKLDHLEEEYQQDKKNNFAKARQLEAKRRAKRKRRRSVLHQN